MKRNRRVIAACLAAVLLMVVLASCGAKVKADISAYEDTNITITGITDEDFTVTPGELKELKCEKKSVTVKSRGKDVTATAIGPTVETFLSQYGYDLEAVESVTFTAHDGYVREFDSDFFILHPDLILSLAEGDEPLKKDERPVRLVIPEVTADQWVKGVAKINFKLK